MYAGTVERGTVGVGGSLPFSCRSSEASRATTKKWLRDDHHCFACRGRNGFMDSTPIESLHNPRIKHALKLRSARARRKSGEFLIDGATEIRRALAAGIEITTIYCVSTEQLHGPLPAPGGLQLVSERVLVKLSYGEQSAAPVAVAKTPPLPLAALPLHSSSLVLVLDGIEKPGNLGACFRTAAACGVDAVVLTNPICELFNPNAIRASRGTVFSVASALSNPLEFRQLALELGLPVFAARVDGENRLWDCPFERGAAIVFGSEACGLQDDWLGDHLSTFRIPMAAEVDSLNVSISAAVTLYEAVRQRPH